MFESDDIHSTAFNFQYLRIYHNNMRRVYIVLHGVHGAYGIH